MARLLILLLNVTGALSGAARAQAAPVADSIPRVLDRLFDRWRGTDGPGCAVGVNWRGHPVFTRVYGMANLETGTPIGPSSRFNVASVSKQFTAMAILLLARDGRLSINDDIRKFLPEIPSYGAPVTIRHLLAHTSGLRDPFDLLYLARGVYLTPEREELGPLTEADFLDMQSRQKALNSLPGAEYKYSNAGYILLALIVGRVGGMPLRAFADERIFKPLGMTNTSIVDDPAVLVPERATSYVGVPGAWQLAEADPMKDQLPGAASVVTTVGDLLRWEANFDHPVVGDRAMFDAMQTVSVLPNGDSTGYGFGTVIVRYRGARIIGHGGSGAGHEAFIGRFPEHGFTIAITCNSSSAEVYSMALRVADALIGDSLAPVPAAAPGAPTASAVPGEVMLPAATLQRRVGTYLRPSTQEVLQLSVRDGRLASTGRHPPPLVGDTPLAAMSADRFVGPLGHPVGEIVFAQGDHPGFDMRRLDGTGRPIPYIWMPPPRVSPAALAAYAGQYCSEELDMCLSVSSQDTVLTFHHRAHSTPAKPVFADGFTWFGYVVQFHRTGGRITGFDISENDFQHVQFIRSPMRP